MSIRSFQDVFSLINYAMYSFRAFHRSSKAGIFVLVVKPWEAIKVHVLMYISMLYMVLSHYEHVLGPPRIFFNFRKKNKFSRKSSHFLMV